MRIDALVDVVCPWCYVGKRLLERALAERPGISFQLVWRSHQLNPTIPPEGVDREAYLSARLGDPANRAAIQQQLLAAAEAVGLSLDLAAAKRYPNSANAHRLLLWAKGQGLGDAAVEALFAAYFCEGRDIGQIDELVRISGAIGLDPELTRFLFKQDRDRDRLEAEFKQTASLGARGVPCVVFAGKTAVLGAQPVEVLVKAIDDAAAAMTPTSAAG